MKYKILCLAYLTIKDLSLATVKELISIVPSSQLQFYDKLLVFEILDNILTFYYHVYTKNSIDDDFLLTYYFYKNIFPYIKDLYIHQNHHRHLYQLNNLQN